MTDSKFHWGSNVLWKCGNLTIMELAEAATAGVLWKKMFLKISLIFTGKHLCQSLFFNKVAGLRPATLLKKRLRHRCFPVNFVKFLRTSFLQNTSGRLLLSLCKLIQTGNFLFREQCELDPSRQLHVLR